MKRTHRRRIYTEEKICTLFFNSSWCKSAYSSTCPGANQLILQLVLVQNSRHGKELKQVCPPRTSEDLCILFCINHSSKLLTLGLSFLLDNFGSRSSCSIQFQHKAAVLSLSAYKKTIILNKIIKLFKSFFKK